MHALKGVFLATAVVLFLFVACGGDNETSTSVTTTTFSGKAVKGPIANGTVSVYAVNPDGSRGALLTSTTTDENGDYTVSGNFSGPLEVVITGGSYVDEATGQTVSLASGQELTAIVPGGISDGGTVMVTPLTHIATAQIKQRIANGEEITAAINSANADIAVQFGLAGIDITSVNPADFTDTDATVDPASPMGLYGLALAALSQQMADNGQSPDQLLANVENIRNDLADGTVDDPATLNTINDLEGSADNFLDGDLNVSGIGSDDIALNADPTQPTTGCTDSTATNYNPDATTDDGGCTFAPVSGCTDTKAFNYNSKATVNDGSCRYATPVVSGCTDSTATNYDSTATTDDGSCTYLQPNPDRIAPTTDVAWATQDNTGGTSWTGQASLDEAGTGYCVAVLNAGTAPTTTQTKAGTGGAIVGTAGTVVMGTPANTYQCTVTVLTEQVAYDFYFVAEDGIPNLQAAVASIINVITPDVTAPTTTGALAQNAVAGTTWTGQATINENGTGYLMAVTNNSGAVTAADLKGDSDGDKQGTSCSMAMVANVPNTCQITNLAGTTTYDFYFVAEDSAGNLQADGSVTTVKAGTP